MLSIKSIKDNETFFFTAWHVGEEKPHIDPLAVVEIQADLDELTYIRHNFTNISRANDSKHVITWYGDTAKFIVGNL